MLAQSKALVNETYRRQIKPGFATSNDTTQYRDCSHLCVTFARLSIVDNIIPSPNQGAAKLIEILGRAASASSYIGDDAVGASLKTYKSDIRWDTAILLS